MTEPERPRPVAPEELGFERIVYEKAPPRATITLNRPEVLNAFDFKMLRELARACEDASWDDAIRAVVLTGAGRAFCVGADLRSWADEYLGKPTVEGASVQAKVLGDFRGVKTVSMRFKRRKNVRRGTYVVRVSATSPLGLTQLSARSALR